MLISIFGKDADKDEMMRVRRKVFDDTAIINKYLFTGKDESGTLFYETLKILFRNIIKPLRKAAEEQARILYNTKFKII